MSVSCLPKIDFVNLDKVCDYVPLISSLSNLVDIFQKCVLEAMKFTYGNEYVQSKYYKHIDNKEFSRCFQLLVPVLGNIYVYLNFIPPVLIETPEDALNFSFAGKNWMHSLLYKEVKGGDLASLPKDIVSILNSDYTEGQKVKDACFLAWIPSKTIDDKDLIFSLNSMYAEWGYIRFCDRLPPSDVEKTHGETPMKTSGWVLMAKEPLKATLGKNREEQKKEIANLGNGWRLPKASEASLFFIIANQMSTPFDRQMMTRCQEDTEKGHVIVNGYHASGGEGPNAGLRRTFRDGDLNCQHKFVYYGVMPLRELQ